MTTPATARDKEIPRTCADDRCYSPAIGQSKYCYEHGDIQPATAQHTPGPWTVFEQAPYSVWKGDAQIAACRVLDQDGNVAGYMLSGWESEQAQANARLIAAAPEMLAALEMVASLPGFERDEQYGMVVRAAIHAAKGE
jgi:hypothetical protein